MEEICIGNIIQVQGEFIDETTEIDIQGWKGCVRLIFDPTEEQSEQTFLVEWTAATISQIPDDFFRISFDNEVSWSTYYLPVSAVKVLDELHSEIEVEWAKNEVGKRLFWPFFGREGRTISKVFEHSDNSLQRFPFDYWVDFFNGNLTFPIKGKISYEYEEEDGSLRYEDIVMIRSLSGWDNPLGVLCEVAHNDMNFIVPLQDVKGFGGPVSKNNRYIEAYEIWLACRS
ncbi:MAG: hypothetical protein AB9907_04760 [Flexilinea sp.]